MSEYPTAIDNQERNIALQRLEDEIYESGTLTPQKTMEYLILLSQTEPTPRARYNRVAAVLATALARGISRPEKKVYSLHELSVSLASTGDINVVGALQLYESILSAQNPNPNHTTTG